MSESSERKERYNRNLEYMAHFQSWANSEPPVFRIFTWHRWLKRRPVY